jgi:hypothetical protein
MRAVRALPPTVIASLAWLALGAACTVGPSDPRPTAADAGSPDAPAAPPPTIEAPTACAPFGAPGECISIGDCAAEGDHSSYPGYCPGPVDVECCIRTPSVADNPPTPAGYRLMQQADVTPEMTTWAVAILHDPTTYPMFSTTTRMFAALTVLARVEWHPPDFQNGVIHRGVTLYEPM